LQVGFMLGVILQSGQVFVNERFPVFWKKFHLSGKAIKGLT
jgi:hypothetical protein